MGLHGNSPGQVNHTKGIPMKSMFSISLAILCSFTSWAFAEDQADELRLAKIFTDNMVLQQEKPIRVWGWAKPGDAVTVTLTQDAAAGEAAMKRINPEGAPQNQEEGYSVTVQYVEKNPPAKTHQSLKVKAGDDGRWTVQFEPVKASFQPAWIFAESGEKLKGIQNVLIGEIWICAGQSNMGWGNFNRKDREGASADFPALRYVAWNDSYYRPLEDVRPNIGWQKCSPESAQRFSAVPYLYGMFLHRYLKVPVGIINLARGGTTGQTWCMRPELENIDAELIRIVLKNYDEETAVWDDPKQLEQIMAEWEKSVEKAKSDHAGKVAKAKAEGKKEPRLRLPRKPGDPRSGWSPPAGLFNATVMPIRHLGVRGVLYYQGENNNFMRWTRYEYTFPKVPVSFRKAFGDDALPFGCISQPGWGNYDIEPEVATVAEGYAIVRDIQRRALKGDPNAGMIATYPTGNSYIHPGEKLPVAEYASLWALAKVYKKPVQHTGNTYREMKVKGDKLYLFFDIDPIVYDRWKHIKNNAYWQVLPCPQEGKAEFRGFIIAGKDRRWYPARGRHTKLDGQWCIELSSDLVDGPVAARYGWANWPQGNMMGRNRLPMPTFRTDDWPIPEGLSYSKEAKAKSSEALKLLKQEAEKQALDRKIRQLQIDVARHEHTLHTRVDRNDEALIRSKISRLEKILDELQQDDWLSRQIKSKHPEISAKIEEVRRTVDALKAQASIEKQK